jgi:transposase, ISSpnII
MLYGINQVPYTPEMNPIEKVWKGIRKRCCKNKAFQTLESVIDKLQEVIQGLEKKRFENH